MNISRREFLQMLAIASMAGVQLPGEAKTQGKLSAPHKMYDIPAFGNVSLMHFTERRNVIHLVGRR